MVIDLRSDILSRPTPEMIEAMTRAATSKFTYGFREDPITTQLERLAALTLGKEDALLFPTGTMCNQAAIHIHCSPGQELIAESESHVFTLEGGAAAAFSGVTSRPIHGERGVMDLSEMEEAICLGTEQRSRTGLIWVENTHNRAGGTVVPIEQMKAIYSIAKRHNIPVHLDGARIFNAAVFLGVPASELTQYADSVMISLNKGLCAPLGAVLAGSKSFIQAAGRVRLLLGGGWRPTGILAAPGIIALEMMVGRLIEDHINTRNLAEEIAKCRGFSVDLRTVQTNIINVTIVNSRLSSEQVVERLKKKNVLANATGPKKIRLVLHLEIREGEVARVAEAFKKVMEDGEP